jgi:hypothetical protein
MNPELIPERRFLVTPMAILTVSSKKRKRKVVEHAITSYYRSLPEQALEEDKEWAKFSVTQFSKGTAYPPPSRR